MRCPVLTARTELPGVQSLPRRGHVHYRPARAMGQRQPDPGQSARCLRVAHTESGTAIPEAVGTTTSIVLGICYAMFCPLFCCALTYGYAATRVFVLTRAMLLPGPLMTALTELNLGNNEVCSDAVLRNTQY
eukprot:216547-Rhodomonas_salina.3